MWPSSLFYPRDVIHRRQARCHSFFGSGTYTTPHFVQYTTTRPKRFRFVADDGAFDLQAGQIISAAIATPPVYG